MPYCYHAGAEMDFSLVVRADISDAPNPNQAEAAEASLAPVMPADDVVRARARVWLSLTLTLTGPWPYP